MALPVLADVKAKLELPATDTSRDSAIQTVLDGLVTEVADRTRLDFTGNGDVVNPYRDIFKHVQIGRILVVKKRPIDLTAVVNPLAGSASQAILVEGRIIGNSTYTKLYGDVVDPADGSVKALGYLEFVSFPPQEPPQPWHRWKYPVWPVIRVSYCTSAAVVPKDLFDAIAAGAAYRYSRQVAGPVSTSQIGGRIGFSSTFMDKALPSWVEAVVKKYEVQQSASWVGP